MGGSECTEALFHPQYHDKVPLSKAPNPQHKWLPNALGVCSQCVCSLLCVCTLDGINAEHKFQVWVTILGRMPRHFLVSLQTCNFLEITDLECPASLAMAERVISLTFIWTISCFRASVTLELPAITQSQWNLEECCQLNRLSYN